MKRLTAVILSIFTLFLAFSGGVVDSVQAQGEVKKEITIVYTNDIHSRFEESSSAGMGYAKIATIVKQQREKNPYTLVVDAGDTLHGQTITTLVRGESIVPVMNTIGYDAMVAGNHDFNYGVERLLELGEMLNFPILGGNVVKQDGTPVLQGYVIKELGGIKVGIFGLATPETAYKTHPKNVEGLTFVDPVLKAEEMVKKMSGKVDVIIALAHLGMDESSIHTSTKVAESVKGIDVIIDGHSHQVINQTVNGTLITQAGEYSKHIGFVNLVFEHNKLIDKKASILSKEEAATITPDEEITKIIEKLKSEQAKVLEEVVGHTPVKLHGDREIVRKQESNLGNLITDAMLAVTGADLAITNGGGIRASIEKGEITKGDIITVLPFGNYVVTMNVQGADIKAALEHGVGDYPELKGAFPQVSGITFKIDETKPKGQRVHSILVQGKPLDVQKVYNLATNDFLAAGGDEYTMLAKNTITFHYPALDEVVMSYLQSQTKFNHEVKGRIVVEAATPKATPEATEPKGTGKQENTSQQTEGSKVYIVKKGDTLAKIAKQHGTEWRVLQEINNIKNPHLIFPGQKIKLP